ncbi:lipopolysaccharide transport system ATP-binding protein [Humidesulfovibrio mexicanus]|uniref:Lipopolysaccharide transport system ATP-binding protein n=1 Tax=Humidesulfovibrio mexicanus TaxID=147047 RepID=A0A238Y648_9BACT|nr:ABC transporter ATP-binding protein [Humidesulfovibrio mexicanus]SNR66746.1 lipopolysaccharide transport system ATP-binding protein [Humidesulfovibrio mexicanus]
MKPIISVRGLSKQYSKGSAAHSAGRMRLRDTLLLPGQIMLGLLKPSPEKLFWALKDISFDVEPGERFGIIGRNGSGKTTLMRILSRLAYPTEGTAVLRGRSTALFGVGVGFKPSLTGRENIFQDAALHGMTRAEVTEKLPEIIEFSGLKDFIDMPVRHYSKGMVSRLAFSVAAHLEPDILMLDEVLSGGDMAFQKKCLGRMNQKAMGGRALLFISHSLSEVVRLCERVMWLEDGRIIEIGPAAEVTKNYTRRMMSLQAAVGVEQARKQAAKMAPEDKGADRGGPGAAFLGAFISEPGGEPAEQLYREKPVRITLRFLALRDDIVLLPVIHLMKDGVHVLTSHPAEALRWTVGTTCTASVDIPADLLNRGEYSVTLGVVTPARPKWRHFYLESSLCFNIVQEFHPESLFADAYRGVVRPSLPWTMTDEHPAAGGAK